LGYVNDKEGKKLMNELTKEEFLKRCETIWDNGLVKRDVFKLLRQASEAFTRLRYVYKHHPDFFNLIQVEYQGDIAISELISDETDSMFGELAGDMAYDTVKLASILGHPCQKCAEDKNAWHTRYGFCEHKEINNE
jgi:hypothetical protein